MSTAYTAETLDITYKQHYAQVVDKFGDTWTRTTNGNGNWVWALGDYTATDPIYGATQTGTLPTALEPYRLELITWKGIEESPEFIVEAIEEMDESGFVKLLKTMKSDYNDPINPDYYKFPGGVETIGISENLTSNGGQAVQYVARSTRLDGRNKGDEVENLEKAIWFLQREIDRLKQLRKING